MLRTVVLIPVRRNNGRQRFTAKAWGELEDRFVAVGGYTRIRADAYGEWVGQAHQRYTDQSRAYIVTINDSDLLIWYATLQWACEHFEQEAIYYEITGSGLVRNG